MLRMKAFASVLCVMFCGVAWYGMACCNTGFSRMNLMEINTKPNINKRTKQTTTLTAARVSYSQR